MDSPSLIPSFIQPQSRVVIAVETNILRFGNRTDVIVVDGEYMRGLSLVECDDSDVQYFNNNSRFPRDLMLPISKPDGPTEGPLDDGKPKT